MLAANIIVPAINGFFFGDTRYRTESLSIAEVGTDLIFIFADCLLLLVSGYLLISATLKIRSTLNERQ